MTYERKKVFRAVRLLTRRLDQKQVDSINEITAAAERHNLSAKHFAYALATAYHESHFRPVRETFAKSDKQAVARLNRAYPHKRGTKRDYWSKAPHFMGRGMVQLTWKHNYAKMGRVIGVDLVRHPELALEPKNAAEILVYGMKHGSFTGKKMSDFTGFYSMRRVVNGKDRASTIAGYANTLWGPLVGASKGTAFIEDVPLTTPKPKPIEHNLPETVTVTMANGNTFTFERSQSTLSAFDAPWDESQNEPEMVQFDTKETKMEHKSALASKTVWGAILMLATTIGPPILTKLGFGEWATALKTHDYLSMAQLAASAMVVYGRQQAVSKLRWPKISF